MIDLHTHSTASDGFFTPCELLNKALDVGLEALALTDHDAVSGLKELHEAATGKKIEVINGAELSVYYPKAEMEILALDIPMASLSAFETYQQEEFLRREDLARQRVEMLYNFGIDICFDDVAYDEHGRRRIQIRRPHITDVLLKKGYIRDAEEAYRVIFAKGGVAYVPHKPREAAEIIRFIRDNGAQAVMAHPIHTGFDAAKLYEVALELKQAGLTGMELFHSSHPKEERGIYLNILRDLKLKAGGGSDFHGGTAHPENELGTGREHNVNIPYLVREALADFNEPGAVYYKMLEKAV